MYVLSLQPYSIFVESSGNHSNHTLRVRASDTVGSLMDKVRAKLSKFYMYACVSVEGCYVIRKIL